MRYLIFLLWFPISVQGQSDDWRLISNGQKIYEDGYCDQPYIVVASDGTWVCTFTTSSAQEGSQSQYIVATYSRDQGRTWSAPIAIEPASSGIEASWAMPLITRFDRIYVFYTFNGDTIRKLPNGQRIRSDTHGWYCYRYSDDLGQTWSGRHRLPMRITDCDRNNDFAGKVQMFWGVGKPVTSGDHMWFSFTKLGKHFLEEGEGWLYHADNILTERDISKINWQLLPDGDHGIRNPAFGSVQEEFNIQPLNIANGLYTVYRTIMGQPACAYSYDNGKTWSNPQLISYANGRPLRNPRACPRLWKCKNGKYLLWYHNHGGKGFEHRNPAWISGGIEKNGKILWSQPEILIYGPDRSYETGRFSYPDLIEEDGRYWISTTQKTTATIHEIPADFFEMLWGQFEAPENNFQGAIDRFENLSDPGNLVLDHPLTLSHGGFAIELWVKFDALENATVFEGKDAQDRCMVLTSTNKGTIDFSLFRGPDTMKLSSPLAPLVPEGKHHIAIIADADARICYMLIDGSICDGGGKENFGFDWFSEALMNIKVDRLSTGPFPGVIQKMRLYHQQMFTSQFVKNYDAEKSD